MASSFGLGFGSLGLRVSGVRILTVCNGGKGFNNSGKKSRRTGG